MALETQLREFGRLICSIAAGRFMSRQESADAYRQVILNEQPELQQGAFLMAHIARGPSTEELSGAWDALDLYDTEKIHTQLTGPVCDIVGTGSDPLKTVNCSTPAALIAAACGLPIAKKGARLVTGVSGASDIFEILGIDLNAPLVRAERALNQYGLCYLPGESFLKSGWARLIQSMRFTSAFNIIGPLTRPCGQTNSIVIGAYAPHVCDQLISVLKEIAMPAALAPFGRVEGMDPALGMDEFSLAGPTRVVELRQSKKEIYDVTPQDFGLKPVGFSTIASRGTAQENAQVILEVLSGQYDTPAANFFCMNAAAALYIADLVPSYSKGTEMAKEALSSGKALEKLEQLKEIQGRV
ncbi:anthranilate phosphoribosyltransferase [Desulforhabdus amnigena]|uniref:Anthranilate phosphoribosyltransferase n=1 Tax=Desulforhabdus amnigena TaxID=40218 RepID=A0A9W6FRC9_9BACT|nr:anthranilate phosphoribosyltransferase [Desulforhabdus amnigena]NLJ28799.1 anthranilate phosphoribosyltransferase [Deltaproteobacteria bacterium]GLI33422.1 anthranilate phosphoribosyltransferase [Desulforhabdus amnigena]